MAVTKVRAVDMNGLDELGLLKMDILGLRNLTVINKTIDLIKTRYLTLLNNNCYILLHNYFNEVIAHMMNYDIALSSCKTINMKKNN